VHRHHSRWPRCLMSRRRSSQASSSSFPVTSVWCRQLFRADW
jgi:hypothetical protein